LQIIYLHFNSGRFFKKAPTEDNSFYTYGFPSKSAYLIKNYYPSYKVEVWRLSSISKRYYEKTIGDILFKVFPSIQLKGIIDLSFPAIIELRKRTKNENIIIYLSSLHYGLTYLIAFLFKRQRIIVQDYGEIPPGYKLLNTRGFKKLLLRIQLCIEKYAFKNISLICPGDINKIPYILKTQPESKYRFIHPLGMDLNNFPVIPKEQAKISLGWDTNSKYILYIGRLDEVKHVDSLIRIWKEIKINDERVDLVFIGGQESDIFYNMAREAGVRLYNRMLNKDLYRYYCAANVYVLLGLENIKFGGIGIAVTESLACGTPVVSSNLRNFIGGDITGIGEAPVTIDQHKEAIIKVLNKPEDYLNCRKAIEKYYSNEAIAIKLNELFLSI
jgi:glycosyltransferase involved in cell wall biosynthesis